MNTKERILKFLLGRAISRKDYDEAKAGYDAALENATDEQKQMASAYLQSVLNKQSADPKTNKHARHMGAEAYRVATTMLNGTFDANAAQTPLGTTGPRTRRQDYADANNVAADFVRKNADRGNQTTSTGSAGSSGGRYFFDALKGLSRIGELAGTTTRGALVKGYALQLLKNITDAESAEQSGNTVYNGVEGMYGDKADLQAIIDGDTESDNAYNKLLNIAGKYEDGNTWKTWFGDYLPKVSEEDKRKAEILKNYSEVDTTPFSEEIRNILNQNNVRLLKDKEGNYQLFGKDWTDYSGNGFNWIDLNQGNNYGHGIIAGTNGRVFLGNTADINESHWANELFNGEEGIKAKLYAKYNPIYTRKKFNLANDYSEENLINEYIRGLESAGYKNPDASYTDVSKLFNGTSKVIAYNPNGTELETGAFGELVLSPDTQFMWENADGSFGRGTLEDAKQKLGGFNLKGYDAEANEQLGALSDLSEVFEGAEGLSGDTKLTKNDFKKGLLGSITMGMIPYGLYRLFANDTIGNKPQVFVDLAVQALKDPQKKLDVPGRIMDITGSEFLAQFGTRAQLLETIGRFVNEGAKLSSQDLRWIKNMYYTAEKSRLDSEAKTRKHKEGGILYAADGTALFVNQERPTNNWHEKYDKSTALKKEDADIEKAQQEGYKSAEHYRANKSTKLEAVDALRFATMAQDAASIVASFVPGAGTGVAAGLGVTALGTDLVADTLDPAVSAGEVIKNAAINAGFAGLGLIPGAKMGKVAKNIIKYAPKIITAAAGLGIAMDESTQATFKKITDGNTKLNREDWRNLSHVLSLVAAGTRGVKGDIARYKVKKGIVNGDQVTIKGLIASDGKSPVSFSKEKIAEVNKALGEIKPKEEGAQAKALTVLKEKLGLTDEQATQVLNSPGFLKTKTGLGKFSIGEESLLDEGKTYDNLRTIWNEEAKNVRNSSKVGKWFANKFGGGDYTAKQRAILELNPETTGIDAAKLMQYKGSNNPMIDWQNLRGKAGEATISARPVIYDLFTNVGQEAQLAHRAELAQLARLRRAEIREKAGVNKAYADIDENERGISGLTRAIQGNDERIAEINSQLRDANIELGKVIGLQRALLTEPRVAKAALSKASKELSKAVTAAEAALGGPLSIKNGRYVNKRTYTAEQRKLIANLNRLVDRKNVALQRVSGLPERVAEVKSSRDAIERQIAEYNKNIADLENEQLGGVRLMQRREANRSILNNELEARQNRARQMNPRVQDEINSRGIQLEGQLDRSVRISGQTIKNGATITSFEYIKNASSMPPQGFNSLKLTDVNKVFPGLKNLRGAAYNPTTNQIIVWRDGGKVNYQKLRK